MAELIGRGRLKKKVFTFRQTSHTACPSNRSDRGKGDQKGRVLCAADAPMAQEKHPTTPVGLTVLWLIETGI